MGGLVAGALINAGISFFAPAGNVSRADRFRSAGITLGLTVGSYILQRWLGDDSANIIQELERAQREIRSSVVPARYVVGTTKVSGVLVKVFERYYDSGEETDNADEPKVLLRQAIQYRAMAISELGIDDIIDVYVNGRKMPFILSDNIITPDFTEFNDRISEIESEQRILATADPQIRLRLDSPEAIRWHELEREKEELIKDRDEGKWQFVGGFRGEGLTRVPTLDPINNIVIYLDRNIDNSVSKADTRAGELLPFTPSWGKATQLQELAWSWIELRALQPVEKNNMLESVSPDWSGNTPNIQFVVKGSLEGEYTENPAVIARWYLKEICGFTDDDLDLDSIDEAIKICDEDIVIDPVTLQSEEDILNPVLKSLFPQAVSDEGELISANLPDNETQTKALNNWNRRFAGNDNSEKRYQCHGVITANMLLNPNTLLRQLGFAMGGWIISTGSKFKFVAGYASDPVTTITEDDLASVITENLGALYEQRYNAIKGSIAQLKSEDYTQYSIGTIIDESLANNEGYREENLGVLPFQNAEIPSRRLLTKYRRRNNPTLKRLGFRVSAGEDYKNYKITGGDRINLNLVSEDIENVIYRVINVSYNANGTVNLEVIEEPDEVWEDNFDPDLEILIGERIATNVPRPGTPTTNLNLNSVEIDAADNIEDEDLGPIAKIFGARAVSNDVSAVLVYRINDGDWIEIEEQEENEDDDTVPIITKDDNTGYWDISVKETDIIKNLLLAVRTGEVDEEDNYIYHDVTLFPVGGDTEVFSVLIDDIFPFSVTLVSVTLSTLRLINARATGGAILVYKFSNSDWEEVQATGSPAEGSLIIVEELADMPDHFNIGFAIAKVGLPTNYVILAARTGKGTEESPYKYHDQQQIALREDLKPSDVNKLVDEQPEGNSPFSEGVIEWQVQELGDSDD